MLYNTRYTAVLCIGFLLLSASLFARQDTIFTQVPVAKFDTWYIAGYTDLLTTRLFLLYENAALTINPLENKNNGIVYRPNVNIRVGIAGFWKWFGLGLSLDNPFYKTDRNTYGSTSVLDLRVNAFGRFLAAELFLQNFKSLYISSPKTRKGSYYIIPDMHVFSLGLSGFWIANEKRYSIRAAFIQNEQQKKSAGSFLVMPSFLYYRITSDHGIIPDGIISSYQIPATGLITRGEFYSVSLSPGYVYTLVFLKNFSITGAIFPGLAAHFSTFSNEMLKNSDFEFAFQVNGRFALGYNSDKWFLGGSYETGFNEIPKKFSNTLFSYSVGQYRLWGGLRFNVFKKKRKTSPAY